MQKWSWQEIRRVLFSLLSSSPMLPSSHDFTITTNITISYSLYSLLHSSLFTSSSSSSLSFFFVSTTIPSNYVVVFLPLPLLPLILSLKSLISLTPALSTIRWAANQILTLIFHHSVRRCSDCHICYIHMIYIYIYSFSLSHSILCLYIWC